MDDSSRPTVPAPREPQSSVHRYQIMLTFHSRAELDAQQHALLIIEADAAVKELLTLWGFAL